MTLPDFTNYNGAIDIPDTRDYTHDEVYGEYGASVALPTKIMHNRAPNLNQGSSGACTVFGSTNAYNETYAQSVGEGYSQPYDPWKAWDECKRRGASDTIGWVFQGALQVLKDMNYVGAYIRIGLGGKAHVDTMRSIIANGNGIATGVQYANWSKIVQTGEFSIDDVRTGGHIFDITGYDDLRQFANGDVGGFYSHNSWGDIGEFWISYKQCSVLYAQYEFALTDELQEVIDAKNRRKNIYLQKAYDAKVWNEDRPTDQATAREIRIMTNRGLGLPDDYVWLRKMVFHMVNDRIVRDKIVMVYNEQDPYKIASDHELAIMFTRGVMRSPGISNLTLSREQVAEIVGRDILV